MKQLLIIISFFAISFAQADELVQDSTKTYKKRVLESTEVDFLMSYYTQNGENAAVTGGIGTEELTDFNPLIVVAIPLNDDDVLTIDAGISAYTSASSSNIDPFDGSGPADAYVASSGASKGGNTIYGSATYSHSSDDRNNILTASASVSTEFDYFSVGFGGSYTRLLNEQNTEITVNAHVYLDSWDPIYPIELRPFEQGGLGLNDPFFANKTITGNPDYNPSSFTTFDNTSRNSYAMGLGFSQILLKRIQGSMSVDFVLQNGLLSTPFQRVYFKDIPDSFIENFHLADDIERLPDTRFKVAFGGQLNIYLNERFVVRLYYRYYFDDWAVNSNTARIEVPVKVSEKFTIYPSYRFYSQSQADYFAPYDQHLSTEEFYTSDYDLSKFNANQYGIGVGYTDVFTTFNIWKFHLKNIDFKINYYKRNSGLEAYLGALGFKFLLN
jgi:hypothetical protein